MNINRSFVTSFLSVLFALSQTLSAHQGESVSQRTRYKIKTEFYSPYELAELSTWLTAREFDVAGTNWVTGEVEVITDQPGIDFLNNQGYVGVHAQGIPGLPGFPGFGEGPDSRYLNPKTLSDRMRALVAAYPNLVRMEQIGTTLQGRPVSALLVSTTLDPKDPANLDKASIIFDGQHHAREVMTPEVVMDVADTLLQGYATSADIKALLQTWNIWLVPSVNPDGTNIVFTTDNMWRKNGRSNSRSTFGVDLNRNYDYRWNGCSGSSASSWAQDYRGTSAASEPETQALMGLAKKVRPSAYLSYHSYSELVLYPYGCTNSRTPENTMFDKLANELASRLPRDDNRGNYTPGLPWEILYGVDGDSMAYMYAVYGAIAFTLEINEDFQPNYSLRDPTVRKHRNAWMYFLGHINQNLMKVTVLDGKTGQPATARIDVDALARTQGEPAFQTNEGGRFMKVLAPGHYVVTAKLSDGRTGQVAVDMAGQPQAATLTVN
jgi:carboxypeptidase T